MLHNGGLFASGFLWLLHNKGLFTYANDFFDCYVIGFVYLCKCFLQDAGDC